MTILGSRASRIGVNAMQSPSGWKWSSSAWSKTQPEIEISDEGLLEVDKACREREVSSVE